MSRPSPQDTVGTWIFGGIIVAAIFGGGMNSLWFGLGLLLAGFVLVPLFYSLVVSRSFSDWPLRVLAMVAFTAAVLALLLWLFNP